MGRTLVQSAFSVAIPFLCDQLVPDDGGVSSVVALTSAVLTISLNSNSIKSLPVKAQSYRKD